MIFFFSKQKETPVCNADFQGSVSFLKFLSSTVLMWEKSEENRRPSKYWGDSSEICIVQNLDFVTLHGVIPNRSSGQCVRLGGRYSFKCVKNLL